MYNGTFLGLKTIEIYFYERNKNTLNKILQNFLIYNIKRVLKTEDQNGNIKIIGLLMYTNIC